MNELHSVWLLFKYRCRSAGILLYCVSLPITPHHICSFFSTAHIIFFLYSPVSPLFSPAFSLHAFFSSRNLGVCTQFLLCKSFSWMDERPWPIHQCAYPPPSPLFLYHLAVNLTSDVPVSFFLIHSLFLFSLLFLHLCLLLPLFLGHTATMSDLPSTPAVKRL